MSRLSTYLMMMLNTFLLVFFTSLFLTFSDATDVMTLNQSSITGNETLISSAGIFELGFFSPGASKNKYIGLWYKNIRAFTVVWVANRDNPVTNSSSATLKLVNPGILLLTDDNNTVIWSTEASKPARNPVAKLLDNGNFVIKESNDDSPENYLWQGFDYPTDTLLPDMKFGRNLVTNHEAFISSWKSLDDPGTGLYNYHFDPTGYPQGILRSNNTITYRTGPWNGQGYSGLPGLSRNAFYTYDVVMTDKEEYYYYQIHDRSVITRYTIDVNGVGHRIMWVDRTQDWVMYATAPIDNCDAYRLCGAYGICNPGTSPLCGCLDKFIPTHPDDWEAADWSNGCVRRTSLNCATDGFLMYKDMKLPDARNSWYNTTMSLEECRIKCLMNCSCEAYSTLDIRNGGRGCLLWFGQLVDIKQLYGAGQDIYIRMAASELNSGNKKGKVLMATLISVAGFLLLCLILFIFIHRRKKTNRKVKEDSKALVSGQQSESHDHQDMELPTFDLLTISKATDDFSFNAKLGEGGFGPVYKGKLEGGQEIAVKRLSTTSMQGLDEFKNEVIFIAKLQHRNLVKLLGCCIEGTEKVLIYEYMPNLSLDLVLFDPIKSKLLDWPKRFQIIIGIARGLLYLHQDSRLRIIHRDLKASNILLDEEMKPKISDFGMARSFGGNETEANTSRVVGTYGYMSPEYAIDGLFSIKSDVFSFGVIVLEILSGKKNRGFFHTDHHHNLLGHAWILFTEGRSMELVSKDIDETCIDLTEIEKSIHVGLLCVQKNQEDRPNMSSVIFMLENDVVLPQPRQPGFFAERDFRLEDCTYSPQTRSSTNEMSITMPEPR